MTNIHTEFHENLTNGLVAGNTSGTDGRTDGHTNTISALCDILFRKERLINLGAVIPLCLYNTTLNPHTFFFVDVPDDDQ
jgi:hypothetical protein